MRKYMTFFRLRFSLGLQYRSAALAGIVTQFVWGFMEIMIFKAFYDGNAAAFPMSFSATVSYIWLQQAFLALFAAWLLENEIFDSIMNGDIAYELCRPVQIYHMWFARSAANRISKAVLRCFPILLVAVFLKAPYGLNPPAGAGAFFLFLLTLILGVGVTVAFCMLIYVLTFFTVSPQGIRMLFISAVEFFAGAVIPLPFFPDSVRKVMELLPFASMQNVPLRIYSGSMSQGEIVKALGVQVFWLTVLLIVGIKLCEKAVTKVTVQGG